ncbi:MAG: hypothetical protein KC912_19305 [Proteobacteria bacterium]|nr:hypothetical protein [Pseudomonadota bacterium]
MTRIAILAATFIALVGCTGLETDTGDSWGDTASAAYAGPWQLSQLDWSCEPNSGTWTYYALTDGWASTITLDIVETGDGSWTTDPSAVWDEYHVFDQNLAYAEDGSWDEWQVSLRSASSFANQVSSESTLFQCGYHAADSLSWKATMYDDDNQTLDCGVWGHRPIEAYGTSCYCFDC